MTHTELFILCLLLADASSDTSQLRGFASLVLGNNAQLHKERDPMNGWVLIN